MQSHDKIRQFKYHQTATSLSSTVSQGSKVCLRSSPVYSAGGKAIHMKGTQLQCGILQTSIVSPTLSEKCSFKVIDGTDTRKSKGGEVEEMEQQTTELETIHLGET